MCGGKKGGVFGESESTGAPLYYSPRFAHIHTADVFFLSLSF